MSTADDINVVYTVIHMHPQASEIWKLGNVLKQAGS